MCLSAGPCSDPSSVCQQPCANAVNASWDAPGDGTLRLRSNHALCLLSAASEAADSNVTLGACPTGSLPATARWRNMTAPAVSVYVGACVRLAFGRNVPRAGVCLNLYASGEWRLETAINSTLASGSIAGPVEDQWHRIQLEADAADTVTATIDDTVVARIANGGTAYKAGMVCLQSGYNVAFFDNFSLE